MRLLWVLLVVVGVAGGVAKKKEGRLLTLEEIYKLESKDQSEEQGRKSCWQEGDVDLCKNGFLFTATTLKEVSGGEELAVLVTLEKSLHPHVTFDLSLRSLGDRDLDEFPDEEEWPEEEKVLARERVTVGVNELRRVVLKVSDLPWRTAYLVVTALQTGHSESGRHTYAKIKKVTSDASGVYVQAEKSEYAPGDTVNLRALVVDGNFDKSPKFAQVILTTFNLRLKETRMPWVKVPQSGILTGNFTFDVHTNVEVRVTSDVTSSDTSMATTPTLRIYKRTRESHNSYHLKSTIHVTPIDPARLIRRGDIVRFRVRSCHPYDSVNAILSSHKTFYSSRRFSFSPEGEELDEVIELAIPQNATEGSLTLTVYGRNKIQDTLYGYTKMGELTSLKLNLVSSHEQQFIRIVDQMDVDMSTIVTFRLEGMFEDSVVSLQAAKMESPGGFAGEETEGPLKCHSDGDVGRRENAGIRIRDDSPGDAKPGDLEISSNFHVNKKLPSVQHPPLVFFDFDRKTSTEDNGTLTVTKTFDRSTEFGTYVVSGATFNWKWGRTVFSNSPVFKVRPPPGTLGVSVAPSLHFGESYKVIGYGKNTRASSYAGYGGLESSDEGSSEEGSSEVMEEIVKVKPTALKVTNLKKNDHPKKGKKPETIGDLFDSLSSKFPVDSQLRGKSNI